MSRLGLAVALAGALVLPACTRAENTLSTSGDTLPRVGSDASTDTTDGAPGSSTTTTTSSPAPSTSAAESTVPTTATAPATTAVAPSTTAGTPESAADLTLIFDGVLPFRFGDRDVDVVLALNELLGSPAIDDLRTYPTTEDGSFLDESGEESFVAPFGRTVCYTNGLCLQFGAGAPETLIFTGWALDDSGSSDLTTDGGLAIGATLADHIDQIAFDPATSCYQTAYGTADGIDVTLLSDDGVFAAPSADGESIELGEPDPGLVTIVGLRAGAHPMFLFADC